MESDIQPAKRALAPQCPSADAPIQPAQTTQQAPPPSPKSFLSKKIIFSTLFISIIFALIFAIPLPMYIGKIACKPCQDINNCPPCPSEQWILKKPVFWSVILPMLQGTTSSRTVQVDRSQSVSKPTPTPDPISNWKLYENKTFHYSIKYPQFLLGEEGKIDEIYNGNASIEYFKKPISVGNYPHQIGMYLASTNKTIDEYISQITAGDGPPPQLQISEIMVGNIKAKKVLGVPSANGQILVLLPYPNSGIFAIVLDSYIPDGDSNEKEWIKTFNQILSTFKFTE